MPDEPRPIAAELQPESRLGPQPATRRLAETDAAPLPKEIGGREGPEPVRYGDWEKNGRCIDF